MSRLSKDAQSVLDHLRFLYEEDVDFSMQDVEEISEALDIDEPKVIKALGKLKEKGLVYDLGDQWQAKGAVISVNWDK